MDKLLKPKHQLIGTLVLIALVYFYTKPPSILWIDSGTMIAAASEMGIPNPPGFPFYMMVGHLFTLLPFSKLFSLELLSIVSSITLLFLVYQIIKTLLDNRLFFQKEASIESNLVDTKTQNLSHFSALFGIISLAFSYQYWSQTQNTEAFIFTYMFVAFFAWLLIKLNLKKQTLSPQKYKQTLFRFLILTAFLYGLSAGANPTVASFVPGVLFVMFLNRKYMNLKSLLIPGLVFALTISAVYSYLPVRASAWPFVNWGNPQTWQLFLDHLHGAGLNIYEPEGGSINGFTGSPLVFFQSVSYWFLNIFLQFTPLLAPFLITGIYYVYRANKYLFGYLMIVPVFDVVYSGLYLSGNQESWFILSWIFFAIFTGLGFNFSVNILISRNVKKLPVFVILFLLSLVPLLTYFSILNRSNHHYSSDYAYNLYSTLEPNAIVLGTGDFFNSLSHYLHEADVFRPDITPVTANVFYVNRWYRDGLRHATDLSISDKIEQIIQYKDYWEYNAAMNQFIDENIKTRPVYVTHLTLRASALAATDGGQLKLDDRFKFVPHGLTLKVVYASEEAQPNLELFNFRFTSPLTERPVYLERNYKGAFLNILNDYVYAYEWLGDWFGQKNDRENALKYYQKAYEISGGLNSEVLARLGEHYAKGNDYNASYQYLQKAERLDVRNPTIHFNLGLSYANAGMIPEAIQEFQSVKQLVSPDNPIVQDADNVIKQLSTLNLNNTQLDRETASWTTIESRTNNFSLKVPPEYKKTSAEDSKITVITNNLPGTQGISIEGYGTRLQENQDLEKLLQESPLQMNGMILDTQQINLEGYIAAVQIFSTPNGDSSQRYILIKDNWMWQFKVTPGNSVKLGEFYKILGTINRD